MLQKVRKARMRKLNTLAGLTAALALVVACSSNKDTLTPSGSTGGGTGATDATLKVDAPTPVSPVNDQQPTLLELVASPAAGKFIPGGALQYQFEIYNASNALVNSATVGGPRYVVATPLEFGKKYTWRVRGASPQDNAYGPWSTSASFIAPAGGYNAGGELYDPLVNGRTIGTIHGQVEFIPGVGAKFLTNDSYIEYQLSGQNEEGEISAVVTNLCSCSGQPGIKTKIMAMGSGYHDITTDPARFTIEKRSGADKGRVAWRILTSDGEGADTVGEERMFVEFNPSVNYLWRAVYGWNADFNLTIDALGGPRVYDFGKHYHGFWDVGPTHMVYLGSPPPRAGPESGTVANMIVRHLFVSQRPRPAALNQ